MDWFLALYFTPKCQRTVPQTLLVDLEHQIAVRTQTQGGEKFIVAVVVMKLRLRYIRLYHKHGFADGKKAGWNVKWFWTPLTLSVPWLPYAKTLYLVLKFGTQGIHWNFDILGELHWWEVIWGFMLNTGKVQVWSIVFIIVQHKDKWFWKSKFWLWLIF